jgi:hypothetical protein
MANPRIEVEIGAKISEFDKKFNEVNSKLDQSGKEFSKFEKISSTALTSLGAAFSVGAVLSFGKAIIDTTAQFQKMEAVLTNTLGSSSAAQVAMNQIVEFASKTPFQVDELTNAFVKLANRGFTPTVKEMTALGDLASSTGKSFDQLAEATLDAMTGEFERLKEFGVRAKAEGDNVAFTFKGVTTEVEKTDVAIQEYLISLGEAEGVTGSMAAISETVGGKISNLGDNFTQLQLAIGNSSSGLVSGVLDLANSLTSKLVTSLTAVNTVAQYTGENGFVTFGKQLLSLLNPIYANKLEGQAILIKGIQKASVEAAAGVEQFNEVSDETKAEERAKAFEEYSKGWDKLNKVILAGNPEMNTANFLLERQTKLAKELDAKFISLAESLAKPMPIGLDLDKLAESIVIEPEVADIDDSKKTKFITSLQQFNAEASAIITNGAVNGLGDIGFAIGEALATGGDVVKAAGKALLGGVATIAEGLGQAAIKVGVGMIAIKLAFKNPATAIAAGVALIALAGYIRAKIGGGGGGGGITSGIGGGGGGGGSSVGTSGVGGGGSSFTGGAQGGLFEQNRDVSGEFVVRGQDLVYVLGQANNKINKG